MAVIDRPEVTTHTGTWIDVLDPVTEETIGQIPVTTPEHVVQAVDRARHAQAAWGALSVNERTRFVRRWLDLLWERQSEGINVLRRENGKTDGSAFLEFITVDNVGQYYIHHAERFLKAERRLALFPGVQRATVYHKPHGVVGIISPWNYPFTLPFMDMLPALIAGNAVILKPSEITPFIAQWGIELMHEAGFPRDVVQYVHGDGSTGAALVEQADYIQFTGSTATGRKVAQIAADRLIPYTLELGGKDPAIVLRDANLEMTAIGLIQGAFENSGQMCISIERVYVEDAIYDNLLERLLHHAQNITLSAADGRDVIVGSMTNHAELERTQAHLADAVAKGAKIVHGGNARPEMGPLFFEPTIITDVDHTMDIMRDETFGPVLPLMRVADEAEALRLANDTDYGLSASIFSRNLTHAEQIAQQINSGDVSINRAQYATATPSVPTGGQGISGSGRRNGREGILKYTAAQSVIADNLIGAQAELQIATHTVVRLLETLRAVRRYIPFV